jgi:hypothetical protein
MNSKLSQNPFYVKLFATFDQGISSQFDRLQRKVQFALQKLDTKVTKCENLMERCCLRMKAQCDSDIKVAESLVNR